MAQDLLCEFTIIYIARDNELAPPYVALTHDEDQASREALQWTRQIFGDGDYRVVAGRLVGRMQSRGWGEIPRW